MKITLIIFFLGIESSYLDNRELPVKGFADTVQWIVTEKSVWRVRTFAIDEDVHTYDLTGGIGSATNWVELAQENTKKNYGDVLEGELVIVSSDGLEGLRRELKAHGLDPNLNEGPAGLLFWSPQGTKYSTKSAPN